MHDEVSETENIRKNLAIERMIVEGCEILLDTSQTFVRQGNARLQVPQKRGIAGEGDFLSDSLISRFQACIQGEILSLKIKRPVCVCLSGEQRALLVRRVSDFQV